VANRRVSDLLVATAEEEGIPYAVEVWTGRTHSDAGRKIAPGLEDAERRIELLNERGQLKPAPAGLSGDEPDH
jgi:hypothetical protein